MPEVQRSDAHHPLQAKELVARKPDVIWPRLGVVEERRKAIRALTSSIPVVVDNVVESVALEFVGDLNVPLET